MMAIVGAVFVLAFAAVASVHYAVRKGGTDGPEVAVARLSGAVKAHDVDTAIGMIDFDAIFEDLWRASAARVLGVEPNDAKVTATMATPTVVQAKANLKKNLLRAIKDPSKSAEENGTFYAALTELDRGTIVRTAEDKAYVSLPEDWKLYLAKAPSNGWMVVGYGGYEKDFDSYKERSVKLMQDRGLAPPTTGQEPPAPAGADEQPAP